MGQAQSSLLALTLSYWSEVEHRSHTLLLEVKKKSWQTFCTSVWPAFALGWPPEGTFDSEIIADMKAFLFQPGPNHRPDQQPYIFLWQDLVLNPPPWVQPWLPKRSTSTSHVLAALPSAPPLKPIPKIYPSTHDLALPENDFPPPYPHSFRLPLPAGAAGTAPLAGGGVATRGLLVAAVAGAARANFEPSEWGGGAASGTQSRRGVSPDTTVALPLREVGPPLGPAADGRPVLQPLQYWPFSSSDLYNWKSNHPPFSEDPQRLTGLMESLMFLHQPTWDDCQQLLQALFTTEERERILIEARRNVPGDDGLPTGLPNLIDQAFPLNHPN